MRLRRRDAAAELDRDADIGHRQFRAGDRAEQHQFVEIAKMADAEHLAGELATVRRRATDCSDDTPC